MLDKPDGKWRGRYTMAAIAIALFAAYMAAYEATGTWQMGTFIGESHPPRFFVGNWAVPPAIAEPFFAPADWIDETTRQVWHLGVVEQPVIVTQMGIGLGSIIAVVCSWDRNRSILWAILAGILSWFYVLYFALTRTPKGST